MAYSAHQLDNARTIIAVGKERNISPRGQVMGLSCALVECNLNNLANPADPPTMDFLARGLAVGVGHDHLSSGICQQQPGPTWDHQPSWWGTAECRMTPACAIAQFYDRLAKSPYNDLRTSPGTFVQRVQGSSFPTRYDERMAEAHALYDQLFLDANGITPPHLDPALRPAFEERELWSNGASVRSRPPINFLFHTEEGDSSAEGLARYCDGSHDVSYHYTLRDRILYDVVDTDLYSWSVLDANAFTINLCFAGSRAGWSRDQWLQRIADIEIACYIAVQDCRKYGFSTKVIVPPYVNAAGIADHKYVTEELHIGTHTDCGPNFPWDKVIEFVNKYTTTEDDMFNDHDRFLLTVLAEERFPSRSPYADDQKKVETVAGFAMNDDGMDHAVVVESGARLGIAKDLAALRRTAEGDGPGWLLQNDEQRKYWQDRARRVLAEIEGPAKATRSKSKAKV